MPYWYEFKTDLVGDRSDEPRLPAHQIRSLHAHHPTSLDELPRRLAWSLLQSRPRRARKARRHRG